MRTLIYKSAVENELSRVTFEKKSYMYSISYGAPYLQINIFQKVESQTTLFSMTKGRTAMTQFTKKIFRTRFTIEVSEIE